MMGNLERNRVLWLAIGLLAMFVAMIGIQFPEMYRGGVTDDILPGILAQDLMTVALSIVLIYLAEYTKEEDTGKQVVVLGILGYLCYSYGTFVIKEIFNEYFLFYIAIFSGSFYSIILLITSLRGGSLASARVPTMLRKVSAVSLLLVPSILVPLWVGYLVPLHQSGDKIELFLFFSILDLCLLMPLFMYIAYKCKRNEWFGLFVAPSLFILTFTFLALLPLSEVLGTLLYDQLMDLSEVVLFLGLSLLYLSLAIIFLNRMELPPCEERVPSSDNSRNPTAGAVTGSTRSKYCHSGLMLAKTGEIDSIRTRSDPR